MNGLLMGDIYRVDEGDIVHTVKSWWNMVLFWEGVH